MNKELTFKESMLKRFSECYDEQGPVNHGINSNEKIKELQEINKIFSGPLGSELSEKALDLILGENK